jgi:ssDNA-binding Zn-finger/Zn-ribbon topoisomerase 1
LPERSRNSDRKPLKCRKGVDIAKLKFYMGRKFSRGKGANMKIICPSCNYIGESGAIAKGSRKTEITLWCCFIVPGLLYTLWRQSKEGQYQGCPKCREPNVRLMKRKEWKTYERKGQLPA